MNNQILTSRDALNNIAGQLEDTAMISVMTNKDILSYYIDGYDSISIVEECSPSQTLVTGDSEELEQLTRSLSRNIIMTVKID